MEPTGKSYAAEAVRMRTGQDLEPLLRTLYVSQRHSQREIAVALGVSRSLIREWLRDYGISREDRESLPPLVVIR